MHTRHLLAKELEAAFAINAEYLSASRAQFFGWYQDNADLFVGIFDFRLQERFGRATLLNRNKIQSYERVGRAASASSQPRR
jgi:hypothetical protein